MVNFRRLSVLLAPFTDRTRCAENILQLAILGESQGGYKIIILKRNNMENRSITDFQYDSRGILFNF